MKNQKDNKLNILIHNEKTMDVFKIWPGLYVVKFFVTQRVYLKEIMS